MGKGHVVGKGHERIEKCPSAARNLHNSPFKAGADERVPGIRAKAGQLFAITLGPQFD